MEYIGKLLQELNTLSGKIKMILENKERIQWFASKFSNAHNVFFFGRGIDYSICMEVSLKMKEISYTHFEVYAASELKHGTISLIENGIQTIVILPQSSDLEVIMTTFRGC